MDSLTPLERNLARKLQLVEIRGKCGRKVPVLITEECKTALNIIVDNRLEIGILDSNPYIFAHTGKESSHIRAVDVIAKVANQCGATKPELIRSTKLRKYTATICQILNLQENELEWLANHLGHSIRVHREFYSFKDNTVELAKVSKILVAMDEGKIGQFSGKTLSEIQLDGELLVDEYELQVI